MLDNIIDQILCSTIRDFRDGKRAFSDINPGFKPELTLNFEFHLKVNYEKEEGYRYLDVVIWAPTNYIAVFSKERWCVISPDDIDSENDCLMPGKDYTQGETDLECHTYHSSCWASDGIHRILFERRNALSGICTSDSFYKVEKISEEQQKNLKSIINRKYTR